MIDVANSLVSALPLSYRSNRVPSSVALVEPAENESNGSSLRSVFRANLPDTNIANFDPPAPDRQGFASLTTALESVRIPPAALAAGSGETEKPLWESLLEEQERIADARVAREQDAEDRQQDRLDDAARIAANEQRSREIRENIILTRSDTDTPAIQPEDSIRPVVAEPVLSSPAANDATPDNGEESEALPEINLPGSGDRIPAEQTESRETDKPELQPQQAPELFPPKSEQTPEETQAIYRSDQERVHRLFFPDQPSFEAKEISLEPFNSYA